jgi:LAO/AO transport system kinase
VKKESKTSGTEQSRPPGGRSGESLIKGVLEGDFRSIARLITLVEDGAAEGTELLRALFPHTGSCFTIGVTGAPGSGKSTLVDHLAGHYRGLGLKVGIIAVDPTSPFTGGAILGDRIRMQSRSLDTGTFIRSMATRGQLGGLAHATADAVMVLDSAGFDVVLVETVGVGQDEVEVARAAQATLVLVVPGMGDDIQAMKAGIMEIGDLFVVNKADHDGADRVEKEIRSLISLGARADGWTPEVVRTVASEGQGIQSCAGAIERFRSFRISSEKSREQSLRLQRERLLELVRSELITVLASRPSCAGLLESLARRVEAREIDPFTAAEELLACFCGSPERTGSSGRRTPRKEGSARRG